MTRLATASVSKRRPIALFRAGTVRGRALALLCAAATVAAAQGTDAAPKAYRVGRALTVSGAPIDDAVVVVEGGKIVALGKAGDVEIPDKAELIERPDWWAAPGFFHPASLAFTGANNFDGTGRREGGDRYVADEIAPTWEMLEKLAKNGFTRLNVVPNDGGVGGRGCLVRPIPRTGKALRPEQIVVARDSCLLMGFGARTSSKTFWRELFGKLGGKKEERGESRSGGRSEGRGEGRREGRGGENRDAESRPAAESKPAESKPTSKPEEKKDPKIAPVADVMDRKLPGLLFIANPAALVHFEPFFKENEKFRPALILGPDAWSVLDRVVALGVPVVLSTAVSQRPDTNVIRVAPVEFMDRGVAVALQPETGAFWGYAEHAFNLAETARRGADPAAVLRAATLTPAELLGVADETGSLDRGKTADIVFWTGDPFAPSSRIARTLAAGAVVFDEDKEP